MYLQCHPSCRSPPGPECILQTTPPARPTLLKSSGPAQWESLRSKFQPQSLQKLGKGAVRWESLSSHRKVYGNWEKGGRGRSAAPAASIITVDCTRSTLRRLVHGNEFGRTKR